MFLARGMKDSLISSRAAELRESVFTRSPLMLPAIKDPPEYFNPKLITSIRGPSEAAISLPLCGVPKNMMAFVVRKTSANRSFSRAVIMAYESVNIEKDI